MPVGGGEGVVEFLAGGSIVLNGGLMLQMAASKEAVRSIVRQCEDGEGAAIPAEDYDSDGDLDNSKIFCAICRRNESTDVSSDTMQDFFRPALILVVARFGLPSFLG